MSAHLSNLKKIIQGNNYMQSEIYDKQSFYHADTIVNMVNTDKNSYSINNIYFNGTR